MDAEFPIRKSEHRVGPHQLYVETVTPEGEGVPPHPAILFLGGSFDGSWIFRQESEFLAARGWPVYAMNLRGFYKSSWNDVAGLTVEDYLSDISAVRDGLGISRVILAGYSMGGLLMLKHAEQRGAEAIVLYDSDATREVRDAAGGRGHVPYIPGVLQFTPPPRVIDEMWGGHTSRRQYQEFLELFKQTRMSGQVFRLTEHGSLHVDLSRVRCPALVIGISRGDRVQEEYFRRLSASWMVFEGSSHGSILVGPRSYAITQEVARWLDRGFPAGEKKIFPQLGFLSWDRQVYRMKLRYYSGWRNPEVVIRAARGVRRPDIRVGMYRTSSGRIPGESIFESTFTLDRRAGFFLKDGAGEDHPPGAVLYRPVAREIVLADGEFYSDRPAAAPGSKPIYRDVKIFSKDMNHHFQVHVMLPRNYSPDAAAYPVCVLNDGQNQWKNRGAFGGWHTDAAATVLARKGRCRDVVLVAVESTRLNRNKYYLTPPVGRGDLYVNFLADTLLPSLRNHFNLTTRPEDTAVVGASYGAHSAVFAGLKRPDAFGLIGSLSYAPVTGRPLRSWLESFRRLPFRKLYLDCGTRWTPHQRGSRSDNTRITLELIRTARSKGLLDAHKISGRVFPGHCHNEIYWRRRIGLCLEFLFPLI